MGTLTVITPPNKEPVTLDEAKGSVKVFHNDDDDRITSLIKTGREFSESYCNIVAMTTVYELSLDVFPQSVFTLNTNPLQYVDSIKYIAPGSPRVEITLIEGVDYYADVITQGGRIFPLGSWPSVASEPNAVKIRFTAGYIDQKNVPEQIKDGIKAYIIYLYDTDDTMLKAAKNILWPQRIL